MSNRRNRPPNRWGCKPTEDVCVEHDMPLENRRGCAKQNATQQQASESPLKECPYCGSKGTDHPKGCMGVGKPRFVPAVAAQVDRECEHDWRSAEVGYASDAGFECNKCGEQKTKLW